MMDRRKFIAVAASTCALTGLAGCTEETDYESGNGGDDDSNSSNVNGGEEEPENELELIEHELVRENEGGMAESVSVQGEAQNASGNQLSYAEVKVRFLDESGTMLDSFIDNVNDLGDEQTWKFEVMYPGMGEDAQEVADYEIAAGTSL